MKIAIGTVQLGLLYGINNNIGIPSDNEVLKIFSLAKKESIKYIDTSISYGNSEQRIGDLLTLDFNVITKSNNICNGDQLINSISTSLKNLNRAFTYGYLIHNVENLIQNPKIWDTMIQIKKDEKAKKIGFSVYSPKQLETLLDKNIIPDIIQLPYSLLDRKFQKYLKHLKELNIEIHIRSVFLQGLYFMNFNTLPKKLNPLKKYLRLIDQICNNLNITIGELCLNFVNENKYIDKMIIGIDSKDQLKENISLIKNWNKNKNNKMNTLIDQIIVKEQYLLNPVNWK